MALILSRLDVQKCLTMPEAIETAHLAFAALHGGKVNIEQRAQLKLPEQGIALLMPSLLETLEQSALGLKVIMVLPGNVHRGLPRLVALVLLLDPLTGRTLAIMEGNLLTALRTGAVSGLATDLLARRDADVLALFGAGVQAPMQVLAVHTVRPLREVRVFNRDDEHYARLVASLQEMLGSACPTIRRVGSAREALEGALLVACATTATEPLFHWSEVAPGAHINAIGAFTPAMREVDAETLAHARIVVDQRSAALEEAGDLLQPLAAGLIAAPESWTELGELVSGGQPLRQAEDEVTVFKSVGIAAQDVAAALYVYNRARALGVGIEAEV